MGNRESSQKGNESLGTVSVAYATVSPFRKPSLPPKSIGWFDTKTARATIEAYSTNVLVLTEVLNVFTLTSIREKYI
jgi:hypothetical protein